MGTILYEVSYQFDFVAVIPLLMLIIIALIPVLEKKRYGRTMPVGGKIFLTVIWCFVLAITVFTGKYQLDMYHTVTNAYKSGEYQIVEGYVENFDPMPPEGRKVESFDINGVHFSYSDRVIMTGYHEPQYKGGVITGDGQYLKIGYIYVDGRLGNIIVYIEELPAPER